MMSSVEQPAPLCVTALPRGVVDDEQRIRWMDAEHRRFAEANPVWPPRAALLRLIGAVAFGVETTALTSRRQDREISRPRMKIMAFGRIALGLPTTEIGRAFKRDHTTVIHAVHQYRALVEQALELQGE